MEVIVDVEGVKCGVERAETWPEAQSLLHLAHEWEEIRDIRLVEGLSHFSQDELAPFRYLHGDDAGPIAPVIFTYSDLASRDRIVDCSQESCSRLEGFGGYDAVCIPVYNRDRP